MGNKWGPDHAIMYVTYIFIHSGRRKGTPDKVVEIQIDEAYGCIEKVSIKFELGPTARDREID